MKTLLKKDWNYTLIEKDETLYLNVLCGSSAMFELKIQLNENELKAFLEKGEVYINSLVKKIQNSPSEYTKRAIKPE